MEHIEEVAVFESQDSEKVIEFLNLDSLPENIKKLHENGSLWGVYYITDGSIVAQDTWGGIHKI